MRLLPIVILAAFAFPLGACQSPGGLGSTDINGTAGLVVDSHGSPTIVVAICHKFIDQIEISADRQGLKESQSNPSLRIWHAKNHLSGLVQLRTSSPDSRWAPRRGLTFEPDKGYIAIASQRKEDVEATQVSFHGGDLKKLTPGYVYNNKTIDSFHLVRRAKIEHFEAHACGYDGATSDVHGRVQNVASRRLNRWVQGAPA